MDSPIKGLERLSEELKIERQKLNIALQERARVRVEVETHKQTIEQQKSEIQDLNENINELKDELHIALEKYETLQKSYDGLQGEARERENQYQSWLQSSQDQTQSSVAYEEQLHQKEEEVKSLQILIETMETKGNAKDDLIAMLKEELLDLRKAHAAIEHEKIEAYHHLSELESENEELHMKLQVADVSQSSMQERQSANEELRGELEESLQLNTSLNEQLRELNEKLQAKYQNERKLNEVVDHIYAEKEHLLKECEQLRAQNGSLQATVQAEKEARHAAHDKCETVVRKREFLDQQVDELRESLQIAQRRNSSLESDLSGYKEKLEQAYKDINSKDSFIDVLSIKASKVEELSLMATEMDSLRSQLNFLRKQMIKRDLEEQSGIIPTKAILDREQHGRLVYEGIIKDLRAELERMTARHDELASKYNHAMEKAGKVDLLQEELAIYKEMAQSNARETQTVALAASEAVDMRVKTGHERQQLMHELHSTQMELKTYGQENRRLKEEISSLTDKLKSFHQEKLSADKKAAELFANNARTESSLEDIRQEYDKLQIELERSKRTIHDYTFQVNDLQKKELELTHLKKELEQANKHLVQYKSEKNLSEEDFVHDLERTKQQKDLYQQEVQTLQTKVIGIEKDMDKLAQENQFLIAQLDVTKREKEQFRVRLEEENKHRTEQQLAELKKDLAQSMTEWDDLEQEKTIKDSLIQHLQVDYTKEKEKNHMLSLQLTVLEEKQQLANQELSVYRSIDVYHSTLNAELKAIQEKNTLCQSHNGYLSSSLAIRSVPGDKDKPNPLAGRSSHNKALNMSLDSMSSPPNNRRLSIEEMEEQGEVLPSNPPSPEPTRNQVSYHEAEREEKRKEDTLFERSRRKAERERKIREAILQQERERMSMSQEGRRRGGDTLASLPLPKRATTPTMYNKFSLHSGQAEDKKGLSQSNGNINRANLSNNYTPSSTTTRSMSQMKKDLEKARKLISM